VTELVHARPDTPRAALVTVGDELLLGDTVDGNAAWLGRALAELGLRVVHRTTVGDDPAAIRAALQDEAARADVVLVTGGLGPTEDDRTREALAQAAGVALRTDPEIVAALEERYRARGYERLPPTNLRQAEVPEGARALANAYGTAPGLALEVGEALLVALPGVPREMRGLFEDHVRPLLASRFEGRLTPVHVRRVHTTGIPESVLAERVEAALEGLEAAIRAAVEVAYLPDLRGVDLRLTARGARKQAEAALEAVEEALADVVAPYRFDDPEGDLAGALGERLRARGLRLATAESCTGGLVGRHITDVPGSSTWYAGGVIAYANRAKTVLLGVPEQLIEAHGAVSEPVARAMAEGALRTLETDVAVAVTGVAGPGGGTPAKPVGTVWLAVADRWGGGDARLERFAGDREAVRERAAQAALKAVYDHVAPA